MVISTRTKFVKQLEDIQGYLDRLTEKASSDIRAERRQTLGLRWLVLYARKRGERTMAERLSAEIIDALGNTGGAVKKKEETHKMAEANRAFAHFRY